MGICNLRNVINIQSTSSLLQSRERGQMIAMTKKKNNKNTKQKQQQKKPTTTNHPKVSLMLLLPGIKYI